MKSLGFTFRLCVACCLVAAMFQTAFGQDRSACNEDYEKFCKGLMPGGGRVFRCLLRNTDKLKPECRELLSQLVASRGKEVSMSLTPSDKDEKSRPVPQEYQKTYASLDSALTDFSARLNSVAKGKPRPLVFGAGLPPADSSGGRSLFQPQAMDDVIRYLDELKEMDVQGVTVRIGYPLYAPAFPGHSQYAAFYKQVAQEVKKRDMKLCVESHVVFANTSYSDLRVSYSTLTFDRYRAEKKEMILAIIRDLEPDYLDIGSEPDTESALTGLKELNDPVKYTEYVRYILDGLNRGKTRIAAGMGSWGSLAFATNLARLTSVDALAIHVYPVTGRSLENALSAADIARQNGKGVIIDETWLTKSDQYVTGGSLAWTEALRRNNFSFWAPLDEKFLRVMTKFARVKGIEYISPYWSGYFFAYIDYNEKNAGLLFRDTRTIQERAAIDSAMEGRLTPTGRYYWTVIQNNSR